jgi:hypothetical protein
VGVYAMSGLDRSRGETRALGTYSLSLYKLIVRKVVIVISNFLVNTLTAESEAGRVCLSQPLSIQVLTMLVAFISVALHPGSLCALPFTACQSQSDD